MWKYLYNIAVHTALPFFCLFALVNKKVRKNFGERLFPDGLEKGSQDRLWIHAASLGESAIAQNLIEQITAEVPDSRFLVTTNTYYARDLLIRKANHRVLVRSLPLDLPFSIRRFIRGSLFRGLILVETELWPNLIWKTKGLGTPIIIVNGRISDKTISRYSMVSFLLKKIFASIDLVLAQSDDHARRFVQLGMDPERVRVFGNLKYFRTMPKSSQKPKTMDIVTFGSIKEKEVEGILEVALELKRSNPRLIVFIVPRELHLVTAIEEGLRARLITKRFSTLKDRPADYIGVDAVVVDTVGDLMDIYAESRLAFVGGSLAPYGGQNMLEPLFFETPVLFGPYVANFKEIADQILRAGAGVLVTSPKDLLEKILSLLGDEQARIRMGKAGRAIIDLQNRVMTDTVKNITEVLWKHSSQSS